MDVLYTYAGQRQPALEQSILHDIKERFGTAEQKDAQATDGNVTVVTLSCGNERQAFDIAERLRGHPSVVDAVAGSFGEHV